MSDGGFKKGLGDSLRSQLEAAGVECIFGLRLDTGDLETGAVEKRSFDLGQGKTVEGEQIFVLSLCDRCSYIIFFHVLFTPSHLLFDYRLHESQLSNPADFLFKSYGSTPNTSLLASLSPSLLDAHKRVLVKPTFQLDPPSTSNQNYETEVKGQAGEYDHLFAIGDICNVDETKLWAHGQVCFPPSFSSSSFNLLRLRVILTPSPSNLAPRHSSSRQYFSPHLRLPIEFHRKSTNIEEVHPRG